MSEEVYYTEDDIQEMANKLDECDIGLLITLWMNARKLDGIDMQCTNPDGTADRFKLKRITMLNYDEI